MTLRSNRKSIIRYTYLFTVFFLSLSGFAQMPIFKRYYVADIPGLGWLAEYYITHYMHYLFAALLIGLCAFLLFDYLFLNRKKLTITATGYIRAGIILGLMLSGILMVIKNLPYTLFSPGFIIMLNLSHLSLVMFLLATGLICIMLKKGWSKNI